MPSVTTPNQVNMPRYSRGKTVANNEIGYNFKSHP